MTLYELTNHEAGIIVYPGNAVAVFNWATLDDDRLPMLSPFGGMIGWPYDGGFGVNSNHTVKDVRAELPGSVWLAEGGAAYTDMDVVSDYNGDLVRLFLGADDYNPDVDVTSGEVYTLHDGTKIIVPHDWN